MKFEISIEVVTQLQKLEEKCICLAHEGDKPGFSENYFLSYFEQLQGIQSFLDNPEHYIKGVRNDIERANLIEWENGLSKTP